MRTTSNPFLLAAVGAAIGYVLAWASGPEAAVGLAGAAAGVLWALTLRDAESLRDLRERVERLETRRVRIGRLEDESAAAAAPSAPTRAADAPPIEPPVGAPAEVPVGAPAETALPERAPVRAPERAPGRTRRHAEAPWAPRAAAASTATPFGGADALDLADESDVSKAFGRAWAFATGGNPLARVGLLILFVGVGVGIRYAAENGLFPIEVRLTAAAAVGVALALVGWRLRRANPAFALTLQGGGVAVLYLTVYAASALYALIPPGVAVALMAAVAVLGGALALVQDAPALAVLGVAGGFAAPVLAGTAAGSHVLLLGYYALLNLGVLGVAWARAWRSVAVVGFVATFVTGGWWGGLAYRPELYASVQPFLVLSFAVYFALAVRFAVRSVAADPPERALAVDGALVFGLPAATFVLQAGIAANLPTGRAWSAAALAAVYLGAWAVVRPRAGLRLLADAFLAVGLVFATLALPLAFQAVVFGALWVLEGAALVWVGARQRKGWMRASGLALQATAAGVLFLDGVLDLDRAFTPKTLTGWLVAVSLGATAYVLWRWRADVAAWERVAGRLALAFGVVWWGATAVTHVSRLVAGPLEPVWLVASAAASGAVFLGVGTALAWPSLRAAALLTIPAGAVLWTALVVSGDAPHTHGGLAAWGALLSVAALVVRDAARPESASPWRQMSFAGLAWLLAAVASHELGALLPGGGGWDAAAAGVGLATALLALRVVPEAVPGERRLAAVGLAAAVAAWTVVVPLATAGRTPPLPFVPLLNPLDVATVAIVVALVAASRRLGAAEQTARSVLWTVAGGAALVGIAAAVARAAHIAGGVPYDVDALFASVRFQAPLAVAWTVLALALTTVAARRASRPLWFFGVAVLALVVAKLFAVDLAQARALEVVGAFVVVGVLVLVVGYRSPLPPKRDEPGEAPPETPPEAPPEVLAVRDPETV